MLNLDWSSLYTFSGLLFIAGALMYALDRVNFRENNQSIKPRGGPTKLSQQLRS